MSTVVLRNLVKRFGPAVAVDEVNLEINQGELFSLLGSSGCGKTTTLRCVAGLELPTSGEILFDGTDVAQVPPYDRDCGMVFQNYALFPHMTVQENVAYGLMARRYRSAGLAGKLACLLRTVSSMLPSEERHRVAEALDLVEMGHLGERRPGQLSGGQQQRVALARALVTRPRVLLFDEPLGALDAKLRVKVREEIRRIQQRSGITTLYVTHDQEEALSISDRIAVMNQGKVVQMGTPEELYLKPRTRFLADFIGLTNIFTGTATEWGVRLGDLELKSDHPLPSAGGPVSFAVRPDAVRILAADEAGTNVFDGQVTLRMFLGTVIKYEVAVNGVTWTVSAPQSAAHREVDPGEAVRLACSPADVLVLEA
ncbi:MAG: ABC transporter ATP-binding protein [Candidatus Eremiobacterota bacterium]